MRPQDLIRELILIKDGLRCLCVHEMDQHEQMKLCDRLDKATDALRNLQNEEEYTGPQSAIKGRYVRIG